MTQRGFVRGQRLAGRTKARVAGLGHRVDWGSKVARLALQSQLRPDPWDVDRSLVLATWRSVVACVGSPDHLDGLMGCGSSDAVAEMARTRGTVRAEMGAQLSDLGDACQCVCQRDATRRDSTRPQQTRRRPGGNLIPPARTRYDLTEPNETDRPGGQEVPGSNPAQPDEKST